MNTSAIEIPVSANALTDTNAMRISGLAGPYETPTSLRAGGYRIILKRRAFQKFLSKPHDVFCLSQHDSDVPLARTKNGSLRIWDDANGVHFTATLADTTAGRDTYQLIKSGVLDGVSVHFNFDDSPDAAKWTVSDDKTPIMELHVGGLTELSIVTWPALIESNVRALRAGEHDGKPSVETMTVAAAQAALDAVVRPTMTVAECRRRLALLYL